MKIVTAAEIKELDKRATADFKIPSLLLMENAARGLVDAIEKRIGAVAGLRVVVLCGSGNNGGDGMAAARHLRSRLADVTVYLLSPMDKISGDAKTMLDAWLAQGGVLRVTGSFSQEEMAHTLSESHLIIDALLGTGLSHPVHGEYEKGIVCLNKIRQGKKIPVVSVDIPSGISADTGERLGVAVKADYTFTIGLPKRGIFLQAGLEHRGAWEVVDIGFPRQLISETDLKIDLMDLKDIPSLPSRPLGVHKGDCGHLLLIAGSRGKVGAASLSALSALRSGAGLVTVALPQSFGPLPVMEAMTLPVLETDEGTLSLKAEKEILSAVEGKQAVAIGPGLSQHPETVRIVLNLIPQIKLPMVIDADGLNALAMDCSVLKNRNRGWPIILTPHPGEMGRLLGVRSDVVQKDRIGLVARWAREWGVIVVLKGAHTVIADPGGALFLSNTGNPGMATAGTGDVLTGMIGSALAQGMRPLDAALWGVVTHGCAGDMACATGSRMMASDLIAHIRTDRAR